MTEVVNRDTVVETLNVPEMGDSIDTPSTSGALDGHRRRSLDSDNREDARTSLPTMPGYFAAGNCRAEGRRAARRTWRLGNTGSAAVAPAWVSHEIGSLSVHTGQADGHT
jgi:hypothetical protein